MQPTRVQRRLAAILVADVVGYSRMMRADEAATLARLLSIRNEVLEPEIEVFGGRVVKSTGDGLFAEFGSAVDAVQYAVAVQTAITARQEQIAPEERMAMRIGINVGDVIVEGNDLFGDGVNVAARLEGLAEPGGICLSGTVHDQVKDKLDIDFEDLGEREVKNISEPVRTFRINLGSAARKRDSGAPRMLITDSPSIAVLPFTNMSGDAEQDYFSDGISEDIITDLSKISSLMVIARNSSFTYKGRAVDVKQVARDLGVRHVLEGSVRKSGNRVRVNAQLIDGRSGGHVWAERYDRVLEDIFEIQDEITMTIVGELKLRLDLDEQGRLREKQARDVEAYDLLLRGREMMVNPSRERLQEAFDLFTKAIKRDPDLTNAYSGLAFTKIVAYVNNWTSNPDETLEKAVELARAAVKHGPNDALAHRALAVALLWNRDLDEAEKIHEKAAALAPGDAETLVTRGNMLVYMHKPEKAIHLLEKAMRLNPNYPDMVLHFIGHAHFMAGEYEKAAGYLEERIRRQPQTDISRVMLAACYGYMDRPDEAKRLWDEVMTVNPAYSLEQRGRVLPYKDPSDWEKVLTGLSKADLPTRKAA